MSARLALISAFALLVTAMPAYAQFDFSDPEGAIVKGNVVIRLSPEHPTPGASVRAIADSSNIDLSSATLSWSINGKSISDGIGDTSIQTVAGTLGSKTTIQVTVKTSKETLNATAIILPSEIDLLYDADSYVPPFYRGRALPTPGTTVRVQAVPRLKRSSGSLVSASDIIFSWRKNGDVIGSASGRGRSSIRLAAPTLFSSDTISLDAISTDGTVSGSASVVIPALESELALYQNHPLYGVMYHAALSGKTFISDSEMTFSAIPYFAQVTSANDPRLTYEWRVNGRSIPASDRDPSEITINADNSSGNALLNLSLSHKTNVFMSSSGSWNVSFSKNSVTDFFKPGT